MSLVPQRFDRVHPRRRHGGVQPGQDAGQAADDEGGDDAHGVDVGGVGLAVAEPADERGDGQGDADAEADAEQAAGQADHRGLDQELEGDVFLLGPQGAADADLAGALGDGGQHDVHDADAADQQREAGDADDDEVEDQVEPLGVAQDLDGGLDLHVDARGGGAAGAGGAADVDLGLGEAGEVVDVVHGSALEPDLGQFDLLAFHGAGLAAHDDVAEGFAGEGEGEVDVEVE